MKQKTLKQKFDIEGIGLFTGESVKLSCLPAEANTGVVFKRVDLEGQPSILASIAHVDSTFRTTCLKKNDIQIHTVEHILSAFYGMGIDNVLVELDGSEIPILNGSAEPFVTKINTAGTTELDAEREFIRFESRLEFKDEVSGAKYSYTPLEDEDAFEIVSIIDYNSKVGRQVAMYKPDVSYSEDIAPSRTFVFVNELGFTHGANLRHLLRN